MLTSFALKKADLITSDSDELRAGIIELGGAKEKNHFVQWGVDTEQFKPGLDAVQLARELKTEGCFVVLSPRLFEKNYNIDVIAKAIPAVLKKIPSAAFVLLNYPGGCGAAITRIVEELGVQKAVRFVERVEYENMPLYYNLADVVVSIPSSDSASISVWEAMACGCPAIVSDIPANVVDRENGYVVPLNDPGALAEAIINSSTDIKIPIFVSSNRELVRKRGNHGENMKKMESLYYGLLRSDT
jgi:glycosyltransferase involved in cell wall biosynthesis